MENLSIGVNAGKVWHLLNEKGELSTFEMCRELNLTFEEVALALGWLSREDKILIRNREGMVLARIDNIEFRFG